MNEQRTKMYSSSEFGPLMDTPDRIDTSGVISRCYNAKIHHIGNGRTPKSTPVKLSIVVW